MTSPSFQFYSTDWLGSQRVAMLTLEEEGAYIRLIAYCWQHGSIPADPDAAARLIGKGGSRVVAENVLKMFQPSEEKGRLIHDRLEKERDKQRAWKEKSSIGGCKSAKMRVKGGSTTVGRVVDKCYQPKGNIPTPTPTPTPSTLPPSSGEHQAFIAGWVENFKAFNGFDYKMEGGRDGKAVKEILGLGILRIDLLEIAKQAWKRAREDKYSSGCKQSATIHGFAAELNRIRVELKNGNNQTNGASGSKGFDRNKGTLNEGKAARYDLKKIQADRAIRDKEQSELGTNA